MARLTKGPKKFYEFLQEYESGDTVTEEEILDETGWSLSSFLTYMQKNMFDSFIKKTGDGTYQVLQDGINLAESAFKDAFTQVKPKELQLNRGDILESDSKRYTLLSPLGNGAVGHVWKGKISKGDDSKLVAVKVMIPRQDLISPSKIHNVRDRFRREVRNGQQLEHDNLVKYVDYGEHQGHPFLVMELAECSLENHGPMPIQETLDVIEACSLGLAYLHDEDCIHRDVKPPNILVFDRGFALGDLGIVKWSDFNESFTGAGTLTRASVQLGSWYYMAPEQQKDAHEAVIESDIYALGVSWFELLTGTIPSPIEIGARKFSSPTDNSEIAGLIEKMLLFEPSERPAIEDILATIQKER